MGAPLYVKLDVNYFDDDKIMSVSSEAELLYVRSLCFAKRVLSDGVIGRRQINRFAWDIPSDELDPKAVPNMTQELVDAGLWVEVDGGWKIAAWEKHNELANDIEAKRSGGERGNHNRWHTGKKGKPSEACSLCRSEGPIAPGSDDRSESDIAGESDPESTESEEETETKEEKPAGSHGSPDDDFPETVCTLTRNLGKLVRDNGHKVPDPGTKAAYRWFDAIDKLLRIDDADPSEVERVMEWCTSNEFWKANILSASKFRQQYSRLRLQMPPNGSDGKVRDIRGNEVPEWRLPGQEVDEYGTKRAAR